MSDEESLEAEIRHAYDGSTVAFRALEAFGWRDLVNLGFYRLYTLPGLVFGLEPFQKALARRALALVEPRPGLRVIDAGCGRGFTTAKLAARGCTALGLDLLDENIAVARAHYAGSGARFDVADVTRLPASAAGIDLSDGSHDAMLCLEAGFHFGAKGRHAFLEEAFRVLRPGGRLVLVDFVWRDAHPEAIERLDPQRFVRDTWCFGEFEPLERYRANAAAVGFREQALIDWTVPVIDSFQKIAQTISRIGTWRAGRAVLRTFRPGLARLEPAEWAFLVELMRAHDEVRRASRYVALVLERPGAT